MKTKSFPQHQPAEMDYYYLTSEVEALAQVPEGELSEYAAARLKALKGEITWRETRPLTQQEKDLISESYNRLIRK